MLTLTTFNCFLGTDEEDMQYQNVILTLLSLNGLLGSDWQDKQTQKWIFILTNFSDLISSKATGLDAKITYKSGYLGYVLLFFCQDALSPKKYDLESILVDQLWPPINCVSNIVQIKLQLFWTEPNISWKSLIISIFTTPLNSCRPCNF